MATSNVNEFEQDFEVANAGAASTYPVQAGAIKQGGFAMLGGHPCKVVNIARSKPGKHGHAKVVLTGIDIFTGKKHDDGGPTSHNMLAPFVTRKSYLLLHITSDGYFTLFDNDTGEEKADVKVPEGDLGTRIREMYKAGEGDCSVTILSAVDKEVAIDATDNSGKE